MKEEGVCCFCVEGKVEPKTKYNQLGDQRPLRSPGPIINLALPSPLLNHGPKYQVSQTPPSVVTQLLPWAACCNA